MKFEKLVKVMTCKDTPRRSINSSRNEKSVKEKRSGPQRESFDSIVDQILVNSAIDEDDFKLNMIEVLG